MRLFVDEVAMEVMKTLLASDQRELIEEAADQGITTAQGVASASFELSEAFLAEYEKRYSK